MQYEESSSGGDPVETVYSMVVGEGALMERRQWGGAMGGGQVKGAD